LAVAEASQEFMEFFGKVQRNLFVLVNAILVPFPYNSELKLHHA